MHIDLFNLLLVLITAWGAGKLAGRVGYPAVLGELMAGIVLGPAVFGLLQGTDALEVLAAVGVLLMMLYIGMEIDPRELGRASWGGLLAAIGGFVTPFALCFGLLMWMGEPLVGALFVGIAAAVTSLATKSRILVDLDIMHTRIAHVMMAGALVADTLSLVAFAAILGMAEASGTSIDLLDVALVFGRAMAFFAVVGAVGILLLPRLGRWMRSSAMVGRTGGFTIVLAVAVAFAELAEVAGLHGVVGTFVAGLFLRDQALGRQLSAQLRSTVHDASIGFLAPIFFVTAGFQVSFAALREDAVLLFVLVMLASVGKIFGTALFYLPTRNGWREGLTIGTGMNGRGAVEIILAGIALKAGIIDARLFSMLVFLAIATTATVPVLLGITVRWLRSRDELVSSAGQRRGVIVVGAGETARAMSALLSDHTEVCVIDTNAERCEAAAAAGLDQVRGNALEEAVLEAAGAADAGSVVAITPNASVNAVVARMARALFEMPYIYVLRPDMSKGHASILKSLDARALFGREVDLEAWDRALRRGEVKVGPIPDPTRTDVLPLVTIGPDGATPFYADATTPGELWGLCPKD